MEDHPDVAPLSDKTLKAIKKALKELRENGDNEDYITECIKQLQSYNSEADGQKLLTEITEKL